MMSPSSALSNCERGTSTFLLMPRMSVNWRRRKRTFCCVTSSRMSRFVAPARPSGHRPACSVALR